MNLDMSTLINIMLYAVIVVMLINILRANKGQQKRKALIDCVNSIKDQDVFFTKVDAVLEANQENPEIAAKARVLKLWGIAIHKKYEMFEEVLDAIDLKAMIAVKKDVESIEMNEDSFFYLYLGIPNILYMDHRNDLRKKLLEKTNSLGEGMDQQLVHAISMEINKYYENEGDRGLAFYEKVLDGNYGEYTYSKTMIGLYKSIVNAMAARIYLDQGETEKYQAAEGMVKDFSRSGVGKRWLDSIDLQVPEEPEENDSEEKDETFEITSESAKDPDVIDAEVVKEEEKTEEKPEEKKEDHE